MAAEGKSKVEVEQVETLLKTTTPADAPTTEHSYENKTLQEDAPVQKMASRDPIIHDDYDLRREDNEMACFIRKSFESVEVAEIDGNKLTVQMLRPNVKNDFIYGQVNPLPVQKHYLFQKEPNSISLQHFQVIDAYAYISEVATDSTSVLSTYDSRKLTTGFARGCHSPWVQAIARKCVGRKMVRRIA